MYIFDKNHSKTIQVFQKNIYDVSELILSSTDIYLSNHTKCLTNPSFSMWSILIMNLLHNCPQCWPIYHFTILNTSLNLLQLINIYLHLKLKQLSPLVYPTTNQTLQICNEYIPFWIFPLWISSSESVPMIFLVSFS